MPDKEVKTIRHLIYYQYAKIVAKSALGPDAKQSSYGFIKKTFREFVNSEKKWSDIIREDKQFVQSEEKKCIYCGSQDDLTWEHIVPKSLQINERCSTCDRIQGIHNMIWACKSCNSQKSDKGLYHYYKDICNIPKFYDGIPSLLEKKYLKTIFYCHQCNNTLDCGGFEGDISVLDLDRFC